MAFSLKVRLGRDFRLRKLGLTPQEVAPSSEKAPALGPESSWTFAFRPLWRALLFVLGACMIVWPFLDAGFWNADQGLTGAACLPVAGGVGAFVLGATIGSEWQRAGFWFALALIAQAVSLQLVNAGSQLRYQHYEPIGAILTDSPRVLFGYLVAQTVWVGFGIRAWWGRIRAWRIANVRLWQVLVICAIFFVSQTTVSNDVGLYIREWVFGGFLQSLNLANLFLVAVSIPSRALGTLERRAERLFGDHTEGTVAQSRRPDVFALTLACGVVLLAAFLNVYAYERHPHIADEVVYLTHARFLAAGTLTQPAPPVPEAFEVYLMRVDGGRWYPVPPPGWPLLLAVGVKLGIPWLVNPILAGLNVILAYMLLRELYSKRIARLSIVLLAVSPWYLFLGMSFMTHMAALTCALLATLGVIAALRTARATASCLGGLALGLLAMIRPLEAVAIGGVLGLWIIGAAAARRRFAVTLGLILGAGLTGGVALLYNAALTGRATVFPINAYLDEKFGPNANAYGFGADRGMGWEIDPNPGHGPIDALINTNLNMSTLNTELFGWSIGSFLPIALLICLGRFRREDHLMMVTIAAVYILHFFYYFSGGPDFAARYWFLMVIPLVALTARGIVDFAERLRAQGIREGHRLYAAIAVLCLMTLVTFVPWRALDKYHKFRGMRPDVRRLAENYGFGRSLVLIRGTGHPDYESAMIYNPLDLRSDGPIYAWDRDSTTRRKLLAVYPDRQVWIVNGPSLTGRGFEVAAGPLAVADLLAAR